MISKKFMDAVVNLPGVSRVLGKGETKSSIEFTDGVRAQVWVHPPENEPDGYRLILADLVDGQYPWRHDPIKLAQALMALIGD